MKHLRIAVLALLTLFAAWRANAQGTSCERLLSLALPNTTMTLAQTVAPGAFAMTATPGQARIPEDAFRELPGFCRVAATLRPSTDSEIKVEVWLPTAGWNGKFMGVGNGGWAGSIAYGIPGRSLADGLRLGYAVASTDTGHSGVQGDGSFALRHPEKVTDFAYRAVQEMTVQAKAIVRTFYGAPPRWSYWNGCSTGGKQGLKEAQRYPDDYDGVLAGAPSNNWTHLQAAAVSKFLATHKSESSVIPPAKYPAIYEAAVSACDALDGVKDGVIEDPPRCTFDPAVLICKEGDGPGCLTAAQVESARAMYQPLRHPRTGAELFPGFERGTESAWTQYVGGDRPFSLSADHFRYVVFGNPNWDYRTLDLATDMDRANRVDNGAINATDPNLRAFFGRGGKLLLYHGWADPLIAPRNTINYFNAVRDTVGTAAADQSMRLFMVPGMGHCQGGPGPNSFDAVSVLEGWVERGQNPSQMLVSRTEAAQTTRTRLLCAYPLVAAYRGSGSTDRAESFVCQAR